MQIRQKDKEAARLVQLALHIQTRQLQAFLLALHCHSTTAPATLIITFMSTPTESQLARAHAHSLAPSSLIG